MSSFEDFTGDQSIVEWVTVGTDDLVGLVAFTGNEDAVARLSFCECEINGSPPVGFDMKTGEAVRKTGDHFFDDAERFFGARVVAGDYGEVCVRRGFSEQRSLCSVAVAAGSEDAEDSAVC